jgi:hypothetical protein
MTRILMVSVGAILILGLSLTPGGKVQLDESTRCEGLLAEIPFRLHGSMIITELSVDESTPLEFIFDTGAGGTMINANTAASLGIVGDEVVSQEGATGTTTIVPSTGHTVGAET